MIGMLLVFSLQGVAQSQTKNSLLQMIDEDRTTVDAIAGCDKKIQSHVLLVAQAPELLNKIEELQKRSQDQFKTIIERYDRDAQAAFYEMARYPNLITDLVSHGRPSDSEADRIISNYPQDIREVAKNNAVRYFDVLLQIERLNNEIDGAFQYALEPYSVQVRESVNVLLGYPEVVAALVNDKPFTTLLGEVYREDPGWVTNRIDLISQELASRSREDLEAYKNQIQKDPQAYNEMLDASEKFSSERNEVRYLDSSGPIVETRVINCYPYWFGYPYWYSDPYWRPRPLYYHTGLYRDYSGNVTIIGLPSPFFLHWHSFYHPRLYPHLSYNYYNFYENHYMKRYRESPHSFPRQGFYRSIENNVIYNPRVNNRSLQKIDRQRGGNLVRRPNAYESAAPARGSSEIRRSVGSYGSGPGVVGGRTVAPRNVDRPNTGNSGGSINQRDFNRDFNRENPQRSDRNVIRRGPEGGNNQIQKDTRVAPVQQNSNRVSPVQQNNARVAPAQQNAHRVAPAQQNKSRVVHERVQSKQSERRERPKREREKQ